MRGRPRVFSALVRDSGLHRSQAGVAHAVVGDELDGVAVVHEGVFAGDPFVDRDHQFLFFHQLSDVLAQAGLTPDQLLD